MSFDARLKTPFNAICAGGSKSGKTTFVNNLLSLSDTIFTKRPEKVILYYKYMQDIYDDMQRRGLIHDLIQINTKDFNYNSIVELIEPYKDGNGSMIIFDDTMTELTPDFEQVFTNLSHHQNCSIIYITQNLFYQDKTFRSMSLNAHYVIAMKNARDQQQFKIFSSQICPGNSTYVVDAYRDATKYPYSYLLLDFTQDSPSVLRLRSKIFPSEFPYTVYLEKTD
jgi:Poxvirus A32 protein